jgi:hypothetical protein
MNYKKLVAVPMLVFAGLAQFATAFADESNHDKLGPYQILPTIVIPDTALSGVFDISWVDSDQSRYYLTDRGNVTGNPPVPARIDVIDTKHDKFLYSIKLPLPVTGNGVVAIHKSDDDEEEGAAELWVGASNSTAIVIDVKTQSIVASIPTHGTAAGTARADELAYDPVHHLILIANDRDNPPFVSFLSTETRTEVGYIEYPQAVFGGTNHGLEQSVWDGKKGKFYLAVPATSTNTNGEIDEIDPVSKTVTHVIPTTCNPAGLALIPGQRLMTSCGDVVDIATSKATHVANVSADEIWFSPGDDRVYFGGFVSAAVLSALPPYSPIGTGTLPWTGFLSPPPPQFSHSIAADSENNQIFLPVTNVGVMVFTDEADKGEGQDN